MKKTTFEYEEYMVTAKLTNEGYVHLSFFLDNERVFPQYEKEDYDFVRELAIEQLEDVEPELEF